MGSLFDKETGEMEIDHSAFFDLPHVDRRLRAGG